MENHDKSYQHSPGVARTHPGSTTESPRSRKTNIIFQDVKLANAAKRRIVSNSLQVSRTAKQPIVRESINSGATQPPPQNYLNIASQNTIGSTMKDEIKQRATSSDVNPMTLAEENGKSYYRTRNQKRTMTSHGPRVDRYQVKSMAVGPSAKHMRTFTTQNGTWKSNVRNDNQTITFDELHV